MIIRRLSLACLVLLISSGAALPAPASAGGPAAEKPLAERFEGMRFRNIGPFRGGRVTAVTGVAGDRLTYYFGGTGGGVWKTTDGGSR